ncbi:MAG: DUF1749 domain-containing protein [archaeon]|jgi:alpha-beta hydrolase superfamily lysophospholipase
METLKLQGELIEFTTKDGVTLNGFIQKSKPNNKSIVIHQHGLSGNFYYSTLAFDLPLGLTGTKYDFFSSNNRGSGLITRFKTKQGKKTIGTAFEKFEDCVFDIDAAIKVAQERGYKEIVLSGQSTGCQKIAYYQSKTQSKKIKALLLLAPGDDYNSQKMELGKKFVKVIKLAKKMVATKKGNSFLPPLGYLFTAKRYLSNAGEKSNEAQLFNYAGKLNLFSKIKIPMLAMFGSKEKYLERTPAEALQKLREVTKSKKLITVEVAGANHQFQGYEDEAVENIIAFLNTL